MRICIQGDNESALVVRGYLGKAKFALVDDAAAADYVLNLKVLADAQEISFDSVDGALEFHIFTHVRQLTKLPVVMRPGGAVNERQCVLVVPDTPDARSAVEIGVLRGFLELLNQGDGAPPVIALGAPVQASADPVPQMRFMLEEAFGKLAGLLSGAAQDAGREQARRDFDVLSAQIQAGLAQAEVKAGAEMQALRTGLQGQITAGHLTLVSELREELEKVRKAFQPPPGERHAGFWARVWAAIQDRVIVVGGRG